MGLLLSPNEALHARASAELAVREAEQLRNDSVKQVAESLQPYVGKLISLHGYATAGMYADLANSTYQSGPTGEGLYRHLEYENNKLLAASIGGIIVAEEAGNTDISLDHLQYLGREHRRDDEILLIGYHVALGNILSLDEARVPVD